MTGLLAFVYCLPALLLWFGPGVLATVVLFTVMRSAAASRPEETPGTLSLSHRIAAP